MTQVLRRRARSGLTGMGLAFLLSLLSFQYPTWAQESPNPPPVIVRDGIAIVTMKNTLARLPGDRRLVRLAFPDADVPVLGAAQTGAAQKSLRRLYAAGKAAGNRGDLYENRDRGHSTLPKGVFPQLARVVYDNELRAARLDYGVAQKLIFGGPVIGNSSTALTAGPSWRSLPRLILTTEDGPYRLYENYAAGQIHVYPEHRDHDPERGDLLPANTPYYLISQGSSGSDQAHLEALAMILAAFRPDTKARLRETGLIAPTVQMIYRRSRNEVLSREAYRSGLAHPSVFSAAGINLTRMVTLANAIPPDAVPPMVRLRVMEEGWNGDERMFDTPSAIARVWRAAEGRREMVVSAADTRDPNGRPLKFIWTVLRGDPERTRIETLTPDGSQARITVEWQEPRPVPGQPQIVSSRIDIGIFADNGAVDSAPGFVSVLQPRHERRISEVGAEGGVLLVDMNRTASGDIYVDPLLFPESP